jgi:hypothetical protein
MTPYYQDRWVTIICPVRGGTPLEIFDYVLKLENEGCHVYFPPRDNPQEDPTGYYICDAMLKAIKRSNEVHVFYSPLSQGCHFDLGMAFALGKNVKVMNPEIDTTEAKSYIKVFMRR